MFIAKGKIHEIVTFNLKEVFEWYKNSQAPTKFFLNNLFQSQNWRGIFSGNGGLQWRQFYNKSTAPAPGSLTSEEKIYTILII